MGSVLELGVGEGAVGVDAGSVSAVGVWGGRSAAKCGSGLKALAD